MGMQVASQKGGIQAAGPFERMIRIDYRPSLRLFLLLLLFNILALFSLFLAAIPAWIKIASSLLILFYLRPCCHSFNADFRRPRPRQLLFYKDGTWALVEANGKKRQLNLLPSVFAHPLLIVLRFLDGEGKQYSFALCPDNLDEDNLRRLRVRLRFSD